MISKKTTGKAVCFLLSIAILAFVGCEGPTSSDTNYSDEPKEEIASFEVDAGENLIEGQYIVVFKKDAEKSLVTTTAGNMAAKAKIQIKSVYGKALKGFTVNLPNETLEEDLQALRNDPNVAYIEQDRIVFGAESQSNVTWGIDRVDQRSLPIDRTYHYDLTGDNVTVYIADSGINYSHQDFGGRASFGFDAFGGDGSDCYGHGTHIAGTVGGSKYGVAKEAKLVSVKMLDCNNSGTLSGVLEGIDWITQNASTPAVVNMSVVAGGVSAAFDDAVENSIATAGISYVLAAGNSNANACNYSPGRAPSAITVGATSSGDAKASFSNYGSCVDLFAPGSSITSDYIGSNTATKRKSGTSMAAPHVAGAIALYLENNPTATPSAIESFVISNATQNIVTDSNTPNNHLVYTFYDASGSNGGGSGGSGSGDSGSSNSAPDAGFTYSANELSVQFSDNSSDSDGSISSWAWNFGDGSSSSSKNPSHTYSGSGTYTVTLTVTDNEGDSDSKSKSVSVTEPVANAAPDANFSFDVNDFKVDFNDRSSDSDGSISSRAWSFGDGSSSSAANPSHTYSSAGSYTVRLTVTDDSGESDSVTKTVSVTAPPAGSEISINVNGYESRRRWAARIYWEGASTSNVEIYRNGQRVTRTRNDGYYNDRTRYRGSGSLRYKVCEYGTNTCSDEVTVTY